MGVVNYLVFSPPLQSKNALQPTLMFIWNISTDNFYHVEHVAIQTKRIVTILRCNLLQEGEVLTTV